MNEDNALEFFTACTEEANHLRYTVKKDSAKYAAIEVKPSFAGGDF